MPNARHRVHAAAAAVLWVALLTAVPGRPAHAEEATATRVGLRGEIELLPAGDGRVEVEVAFPAEAYAALKAEGEDPRRFLRSFASHRNDAELTEASARFDDDRHAVVIRLTERGGVRNLGDGRWELTLEPGPRFELLEAIDGRTVARFAESGTWPNGLAYEGGTRYRLPAGARDAAYDPATRRLTWSLPRAPGTGPARLQLDLRVKPRLMTAIYKVYGLGATFSTQWVAKALVRHEGGGTAYDLRVRFRLAGYSEWGLWQKVKEMVPGQTAVCTYYPVLDEKIAGLSSNTPANLMVEWSWRDAEGRRYEDTDGARLVLLGVHEFVFSDVMPDEHFGTWQESFNNVPFLAAWVSRDDLVVKQFAAWANKRAGGVGATTDNQSTLALLRSLYELMQVNDFTYQHPPTLADRSVSFDVQQVQNVKFPRDVLRDRSGTCIDLAILYAAAAGNVGIPSYLAVVPGHCFPVFRLPDGDLTAVESTGVGGGQRFGSAPFARMLEVGVEELVHWQEDGRILVADVRALWTQGVSNPELPDLEADILARWGLRQGDPGPDGAPEPPREALDLTAFVGTWSGRVEETTEGGARFEYPLTLVIRPRDDGQLAVGLDVRAVVPGGADGIRVEIGEGFVVRPGGAGLAGRGTTKRLLVDGQVRESALDEIELRLVGGRLRGRYGNDQGGTAFELEREPGAPVPAAVLGAWQGRVEEELEGRRWSYPMRLDVRAEGAGYVVVQHVDAQVPTRPEARHVVIEETYEARGDATQFTGRTVRKSMQVDGREIPGVFGTITGRVEGDTLVGRFGSDQQGYTEFRLPRHAVPAFVGRWAGEVSEVLADGSTLVYPVAVTITEGADGRLVVRSEARAEVPMDQGPVVVVARMEATGRVDGSALVVVGTRKTFEVAGQLRPAAPDSGTLTLEDGQLVGQLGNEEDGQTPFRLDRRP